MAKTLDFNSVQRPTMTLIMKDVAQTKIRVGAPTEALIERLQALMGELEEVLEKGDSKSIRLMYDLAAELINCNRDFIRVTGADLRDLYNLYMEDLILFFNGYLDFINEITHAKN